MSSCQRRRFLAFQAGISIPRILKTEIRIDAAWFAAQNFFRSATAAEIPVAYL